MWCVGVVLFFTYHTVWFVCAGHMGKLFRNGKPTNVQFVRQSYLCPRNFVLDIRRAPHEGAVLKSDVYFASVKYRIRAK